MNDNWPAPSDFELENGVGIAGIDGIDWDALVPLARESGTGRSVWLDRADLDYDWREDSEYPPFDTVNYTATIVFPAEDNEITTQYIDGMLQITINRNLTKRQIHTFIIDVERAYGIANIELDNEAQFSSDYTAFMCQFRPGVLRDIEAVREDVKAYARGFMDRLRTIPVQRDLFSLEPVQPTLF